jgi:hypothetical protein
MQIHVGLYLCHEPSRIPNLDRETAIKFARAIYRLFVAVAGEDICRT